MAQNFLYFAATKKAMIQLHKIKKMKITTMIIGLFLMVSCGSSKKVIPANPQEKIIVLPESNQVDIPIRPPIPMEEKVPENKTVEEEIVHGTEQKPTKDSTRIAKEEVEEESIETISHQSWDNLLQKHVSGDGNVDYRGFRRDRLVLNSYLTLLSENMLDETWGRQDKLAYWMNVYNAFTIKLIIDNYPVKSIKDIKDPWDIRFFKLGKKWYNLNEVEHQILRKMRDPRIHFGINCASFSCPPLLNRAFTAHNVNEELEKLAIRFINDPYRNRTATDPIQLSKIFSWFAKDFKKEGSLIDYLNKYTKTKIPKDARKSFMDYNWNLNE